jgi:UTP-glucose-1-phosphate uridylyltransferase
MNKLRGKMKPTLLILAAGMVSRYGSLKQLDPVGGSGETIMEYSIYDAIRAGFGRVVFVIRKSTEQEFCNTIIAKLISSIKVEYVFQKIGMVPAGISYSPERQKPWGAIHAILSASGMIHEPFAVINADDCYGWHSFQLMADFLSNAKNTAATYATIGYNINNTLSEFGTVSRGICRLDDSSFLLGVTERTKIGKVGNEIVYFNESNQFIVFRFL